VHGFSVRVKLVTLPEIGPRPLSEFVYGGSVDEGPDPATCSDGAWADFVFHRTGEPNQRNEWWYHRPTGTWFWVERDTETDRIVDVRFASATPHRERA
jgi:sarcosine oxidase subunit delta